MRFLYWKKKFRPSEVIFDLDSKIAHLKQIEQETLKPDFWNDNENAQKILKERTSFKTTVDFWEKLNSEMEEGKGYFELAREEKDEETLREVYARITRLEKDIQAAEFKHMLGGENDPNNAIVSIHSGAGGTEAQDWSEMLLRMYLRWAERKGFQCEIIDYLPGEEAGVKSVTLTVNGEYAYGYLKAESGIHRLVRISPFDAGKRRHTSFSSVFVYPEIKEDIVVDINEDDLRIDTYRSSGAGGQHVNKTDSAVRLTHLPTGIVVQCQNERSQHKNKAMAMKVLKARLYELKRKEQEEKMEHLHSVKKDIAWGSQIRSYTLQPYRLAKDHRTNLEVGNVDAVLDGDLDQFIEAYLLQKTA
ncbi:MAG: peptide chain release factor 2 [Deltaproteobacteria bacterium]|nr:peptide chain release factor 2 [Deltaproteobacteria bacterium]